MRLEGKTAVVTGVGVTGALRCAWGKGARIYASPTAIRRGQSRSAHVHRVWARSTLVCAVSHCTPGVVEAERIADYQHCQLRWSLAA